MLRGIDVSGYQALGATYSHPNVETAYSGSDFVIAKATQGTQPMNRYMTAQLQRALADGKLIGVYHYAEGGSPVAEADAFVACVSGYIGAQRYGQGSLLTVFTLRQAFTPLYTPILLGVRR